MVRAPFYDKNGIKKGAWNSEEDEQLRAYVQRYGHWNWRELPKFAGLSRCGKSCRLRWMNYLRPDVKRGNYTPEEESLIMKLHEEQGNKWSMIAAKLPGRTDNEIKNHWHTHLKKRSTHSKKSSKSQETSDQSCDSSRSTDQTSHNNGFEREVQSNIISTTPLNNDVLSPQILESSQYSPIETTSSGSSSMSSNSNTHEPHSKNSLAEDHMMSTTTEILSHSLEAFQEYYSGAGDFWTEPFLGDNIMSIQNDRYPTSSTDGGILSSYLSFCDDGMDYLFDQ